MRGKTNKSRIFSNPNLLDNWYFVDPINQPGNTSISVENSDFLIDRWRIYSYQNGTASIVDNGIQLNGEFDFGEVIESSRIPNRNHLPITLSAMLSDGTVLSKTILLQNTGSQEVFNYQFNNGFRISYVRNWDDNEVDLFFYNAAGGNFTVRAGKLELGTISTLANDVPPNYAEELLKCQKYYTEGIVYRAACSRTDSYALSNSIEFPVKMRIAPTVTLINSATGEEGSIHDEGNANNYKATVYAKNEYCFYPYLLETGFGNLDQFCVKYRADARL